MVPIKHILVTTDLSNESRSAAEYAEWIAAKEKASITLLYCVDNLPSIAYHTVNVTFDAFREELLKQERRRLDKYVEKLPASFRKKATVVMVEGNASRKIIDFAAKNNVDMIVMNTHGRTGIQHAVLGSIAEKVVRYAPCPVLTIRSEVGRKYFRKAKKKV
ncbi:MAG: universal stress protein [Bacteroidota bacterium]